MRWEAFLLCLLLAGCLQGPEAAPPTPSCPVGPWSETQEVVIEDMQGGARLGETASQAVPVTWSVPLPETRCMEALEARITWQNSATAGADLYVGVAGGGRSFTGHDAQQAALDGRHTEDVLVPVGAAGIAPDAIQDLTVLIHTDWASASAEGLPVTVEVLLHFA